MRNEKIKKRQLQLREKLVILVGAVLLGTIAVLSGIAWVNLSNAYEMLAEAEEATFDTKMKTAAENVIGMLTVNDQRFRNGELTEQQAMENALALLRDTRYDDGGGGYFWAYTENGASVFGLTTDQNADAVSGATPGQAEQENASADAVSGATPGQTEEDSPSADAVSSASLNRTDESGTLYVQEIINAGNLPEGGYTNYYTERPGQSGTFLRRSFTMKFEPYGWYVNTGSFMDEIQARIAEEKQKEQRAYLLLLAASLCIAVFGIVLLHRILTRTVDPLRGVTGRISLLAEGDVQTPPVPLVHTRDEIEVLTQAAEGLILQMRAIVSDITGNLARLSDGDLTHVMAQQYTGDFAPIRDSMLGIQASLNETLGAIRIAAEQIDSGSAQVSDAAQALATATAQQAATVDSLFASTSQVAHQANETAENARQAAQHVEETNASIQLGNTQMSFLSDAMQKIDAASAQIGSVTKLIEDIAFQTNILALNAAIEASRAGVAGKGFAVVAEEVGQLAKRSAEAAKRTEELIEHSVRTVAEGDRAAQSMAQILQDIAGQSQQVKAVIGSIEQATTGQAFAIEQITQGLSQVSDVVQTNAATAEQSSAASEELAAQARLLYLQAEKFKLSGEGEDSPATDFRQELLGEGRILLPAGQPDRD